MLYQLQWIHWSFWETCCRNGIVNAKWICVFFWLRMESLVATKRNVRSVCWISGYVMSRRIISRGSTTGWGFHIQSLLRQETHIGLYIEWPSLSAHNPNWNMMTISLKLPSIKCNEILFARWVITREQTKGHGQTDVWKLIGAFLQVLLGSASKNCQLFLTISKNTKLRSWLFSLTILHISQSVYAVIRLSPASAFSSKWCNNLFLSCCLCGYK